MKKNEDGYILLWTFMVLVLFVLLISALLAAGSGMLSKSKRSAAKRQQAFTAKSVVDVLADAVCNHPEETPGQEILSSVRKAQMAGEDYDSAGGRPFAWWERVEGLPREMGECRIRIWYQYREQTIAISARAGTEEGDGYVLTLLLRPEDARETAGEEATGEETTGEETTGEETTGEEAKGSPEEETTKIQEEETVEDKTTEDTGRDPVVESWRPYRYREE